MGLDGDCEAASSPVAVPIRSLIQNSIASKDKCDSMSSVDTVRVRKIQHLVKDMVAALREVMAWQKTGHHMLNTDLARLKVLKLAQPVRSS